MGENNFALNWLRVRMAKGMTRAKFYALMREFITPEEVLNSASENIIHQVRSMDKETVAAIKSTDSLRLAEEELELMKKFGVRIVTRSCPDYPENFKISSLQPPMIYVKGTLYGQDKCSVAMVGSRKATQYGKCIAAEFSEKLAQNGLTVISGFARGIDTEAHLGAVKGSGRTFAVLGNGLATCYPAENRGYVSRIAEHGALISEYPMKTPPDKFNFPERNHLIAALSLGVMVVEAAEKSGTLITAKYALEENRFLFAVPGDIMRVNSRGTNRLIQEGARMIIEPKDVLIEMRHVLRGYLDEELSEEELPVPAHLRPEKPKPENFVETVKRNPDILLKNLTDHEFAVLKLIRHEAKHFDELAAETVPELLTVQQLSATLMQLELRGVIKQLPGRVYMTFHQD